MTNAHDPIGEGRRALERGDLALAERLLLEAIASTPEDPGALEALGACLIGAGRPGEAVAPLSRALDVGGARPVALAALVRALEQLVAEGRDEQRAALVRALEALRSLAPEAPAPWLDLGDALGGRGEEAERCYARALALAPGWVDAAERLGDALLARGAPEEAERVFGDLVERDPTCAIGWAGLGQVALQRGKLAAAEEHIGRALKLDGSSPRAHRALALACERAGRPDEAVPHEEAGGLIAPEEVPGAWSTAGLLLEGRGEAARARRCFARERLYKDILCHEAAARLRPRDREVSARLAELYRAYGDAARAEAWARRAGAADAKQSL